MLFLQEPMERTLVIERTKKQEDEKVDMDGGRNALRHDVFHGMFGR